MSWFRKALSICMPDRGAYYTVISPTDFYEWRFTQTAPRGSVFTKQLPPSDIFTEGQIIASAYISDDHLESKNNSYKLKEKSSVDITLKVGAMLAAAELVEKYHDSKRVFDTGINRFKESALMQGFLHSEDDFPHLYHIKDNNNSAVLENYGKVSDIRDKIHEARTFLLEESSKPKGRALEKENFRRFENIMEFVNNSHLPVDASKMRYLLSMSGIKSTSSEKLSWKECYLRMSKGAQLKYDEINHFEKKNWVKAALQCNN